MYSSGDIGYCQLLGHSTGIILTWDNDNNVISVDCNHETCGYSQSCELYQKRPVGFHQTYPIRE